MNRNNAVIKKKNEHIFFYVFAAMLIYVSGSAITSIEAGKNIGLTINFCIYFLGGYCVFKQLFLSKMHTNDLVLFFCVVLFGSVSFLHYPPAMFAIAKRLLLFLLFYLVAKYIEMHQIPFEKYMYKAMILLCCISLIYFFLINVVHLSLAFSSLKQSGDNLHTYQNYNFVFFTGSNYYTGNLFGFQFYRLQSVFWEPGVFGVYLNMVLFYYFYVLEVKKKYQLAVLLLCAFLTLSTTGICLTIIITGSYLFQKIHGIRKKVIVFFPLLLIVVGSVSMVWLSKKNLSTNIWSSYSLRMNDLTNGLAIWKDHFFLGTGFNNTELFSGTIESRGSSNGLVTWCYTTGLLGTAVVFFPFVAMFAKARNLKSLLLMAVFAITNMTEPLISSYFMIFFIARMYSIYLYRHGGRNHVAYGKEYSAHSA